MLGKGYLCAVVKEVNWPTIQARDYRSVTGNEMSQRDNAMQNLNVAVTMHGLPAPVNPSTDGSRPESLAVLYPTPRTTDWKSTPNAPSNPQRVTDGLATLVEFVHAKEQAWATPSTMDHLNVVRTPEERSHAANKGSCKNMREEVHQWATPRIGGEEGAETRLARGKDIGLHGQVGAMKNSAKLNSRWVETLMGLPVGWTMPSCVSPVTIERMNSDSSATESYPQPQNEHSELF